jgi:signal transduction histidine kinase
MDVEVYAAPLRLTVQGQARLLVVESIRDLEAEVRFSQEQRLSELGRLAAGVAHEIYNPLGSVRLALHAAERAASAEPPAVAEIREDLALVDHEVEQCIRVTERLLKLSMPPAWQEELIDLGAVVAETLKLLHWEAETRSVEIGLEVADPPLRVLASDGDLRMMTLNLAQNACHAMPQGGRLRVRCAREQGLVTIVFEDTGIGIEPRDQVRIFEPFFSRRADGVRGTGLGLAITKSIVESHRGRIGVESEPDQGCRVTVSFPDADAEPGS